MCGISGYFGRFAPALLEQFAARLAYRGPDGHGVWQGPDVGLAHNRLSIIDLSAAANQPMQACGGRYILVFNGEIYNYQTLVPELQGAGYDFNPHSDTAIIAPLLDKYGLEGLHKLQGMFAFGLYDRTNDELLLVRDHAGIKPLYYAQTPQGLVFASELKALTGVPGLDDTPDAVALQEYLSFLWTPSQRTPLRGVKKLRPGHWLKAKRNGDGRVQLDVQTWYRPTWPQVTREGVNYPPNPSVDELLARFNAVVAEQCVADVPIGAFLSGGVDSSALVASMCATGHAPLQTYCLGFANTGMASEGFDDDLTYAQQMAARLNLPLREIMVDVPTALATLPDLAWQLDEPTADPAPLFVKAISEAARADGLKVLISGSGGDDVFTGYRRHQAARLRQLLGRGGWCAGRAAEWLADHGEALRLPNHLRRRLLRLAGLLGTEENNFLKAAFLTNGVPEATQLVRPEALQEQVGERWGDELLTRLEETRGQDLITRLLHAEQMGFLPDHNLNYADKAGMAAGIEIRVPFTDRRLMDWLRTLNPRLLMPGLEPKHWLKTSQRGRLPESILNRSKTGFGAPMRGWMQGAGKAMVQEAIFEGPDVDTLMQPAGVRALWDDTAAGRVDGTYTLVGLAMWQWWWQAWRAAKLA